MNNEDLERRLVGPRSPFELHEACIDGAVLRLYRHGPADLNSIYSKAIGLGDATLAVLPCGRISYRSVFAHAMRVGKVLREKLCVGPGCRVALAIGTIEDWIGAFVAVTSSGGTAVLIPSDDANVIARNLASCRCSIVVADDQSFAAIATLCTDVKIITTQQMLRLLAEDQIPAGFGTSAADFDSLPKILPTQECIVAFTSGTTGEPKGVVLTQLNVVNGLMNMMLAGALSNAGANAGNRRPAAGRQSPCGLIAQSLSYIGGFAPLLLTLMQGGRVVILPRWNEVEARRLIDAENVTSLTGLDPAQLRELMRSGTDLPTVSSVTLTGAVLQSPLLREIERVWPNVTIRTGYGLTETFGSIASIAGSALRARPQSCGRIIPTLEVRIVDPEGNDVAEETIGEICLRGASVMSGYCNGEGALRGLENGWFRTGDAGYLTEGRYLHVVDRVVHFIDAGGRRIAVSDIERDVIAKFGVMEVAVIDGCVRDGLPLLLVAIVQQVSRAIRADDIRTAVACSVSLPESSIEVLICDTLPRKPSGKVDRAALRQGGYECRTLGAASA